jgi:hypothetical protein
MKASPAVDAYVLALISERTLSMDQLGEAREGGCRLASTFAAELAGTLPFWCEQAAPHAEREAHTLQAATGADLAPMVTPLTHTNLIAAIDKRSPNRKAPSRSEGVHPTDLRALRCFDLGPPKALLRYMRT